MTTMVRPRSCDIFVVLPPLTHYGVVFGKNSDRPQGEVQEVVYFPATKSTDQIQCTYIKVESVGFTKAVILSKPAWMWGAEMGANECGVAIGNEAIYTNNDDGDHNPAVKRLTGMDLVRLGLERSSTALEALEVITHLLAQYGQGGSCSPEEEWSYHNSFLIADPTTAWVLETSGKHWAAVNIQSGYKNISNVVTITTKIDKMSDGLLEYAVEKRLWDGKGEFNFCKAFSGETEPESDRLDAGKKLLQDLTACNNFRETDMFEILRHKESGICMSRDGLFSTQGSQVSLLTSIKPSVHWFTATPDPSESVYKPFVFTPNVVISKHTKCLDGPLTPHTLYLLHKNTLDKERIQRKSVIPLLRNMEADCVRELDKIIENIGDDLSELDELFKDCVETEVKFHC